jgi:hypothetical protein
MFNCEFCGEPLRVGDMDHKCIGKMQINNSTPYPQNMTREQALFDTAQKAMGKVAILTNGLNRQEVYEELSLRSFQLAEAMLKEFDKRKEGDKEGDKGE